MLEKDVERPACAYAKEQGWRAYKIRFLGLRGAPDRLFTHRLRKPFLLEFKKPGEFPTPQQLKRHKELRDHGFDVRWTSNLAEAKQWLRVADL